MGGSVFIGGGVSELTIIDYSQSRTIPATAEEGDVLVALLRSSTGAPSTDTPDDFNLIVNTSGVQLFQSSWKVLEASDLGGAISGGVDATAIALLLLFRPDEEISSVTVADVSGAASSSTFSDQNVQATLRAPPVIVFGAGARGSGTGTPVPSSTPGFDQVITRTGDSMAVGFKVYNDARDDHVNSLTISGTTTDRFFQSFSISFS